MARLVPALVFLLLFDLTPTSAQGVPQPRTVVDLEFPTGIAFLSDGTMVVNERAGRIRVVRDGRLQGRPLAEIPTRTAGETGLLGIAVAPDDGAVFVFATEPDGATNSVWRVPLDEPGASEKVIEGLPASGYHNGGGVAFDQDGMLLVSNGEQHTQERAQDPDALGGKVYRFTPNGRVPGDNPFGDSPALAIGLRNPFGLTVDPVSGAAWVTENGPEDWDEVNRIEPGGNYGWPEVKGPGNPSGLIGEYHDPVLAFEQIIVPTGIAFAGDNARRAYRGDLFFGNFAEGSIRRVRLNEARTQAVSDDVILSGEAVVDVAWGPRGLYYATPEAVKLLPIARRGRVEEPSPTETEEPSPTPQPEPSPAVGAEDDRGIPPWTVAVAAGLVLAFWWTRRRINRATHADTGK
jgi:glucose/arabinose dehydrogenase